MTQHCTMSNKRFFLSALIALFSVSTLAQNKSDIEALAAASPKKVKDFPVKYHILLPSPDLSQWDKDYEVFLHALPAAVRKTQAGLQFSDNGVNIWWCTPAAITHAQLDTATRVMDETLLQGVWRSVKFRRLLFIDSVSYPATGIFRTDTVTEENTKDDAFVVFDDREFRMYVKEEGKKSFKSKISAKFDIEGNRFLMLYKLFKASSGISQVGLDKEGQLIINYSTVIERKMPAKYITYVAMIEQMIFEKVK
jgi:hypothetical protein